MKTFGKVVFFVFFSFYLLFTIIEIFQEEEIDYIEEIDYVDESPEEYSTSDTIGVFHSRNWFDQHFVNEYKMSYELSAENAQTSSRFRNQFEPPITTYSVYENYWGSVYQFLVNHDSTLLQSINDSLFQVGKNQYLNRTEFADMLVAFVQDIPYSYIIQNECTSANEDSPCLGQQEFGILSPIEFLYSLYGDCDTRTTLLYSLLNHFGYKTVVFISKEYAHAMLGVELPATGDYIRHKGRKFYFWETTNTGWNVGDLPNEMDNKNYWKIALDYEY